MRPIDTNNSSLALPPIDTSNANLQEESPLVGRMPAEIRNHIFDLALTAYPGKQEPFEEGAYHCRPGFRYADVKIDTTLLRTCRRIYEEARLVPRQNYVQVAWRFDRDSLHPSADIKRYCRGDAVYPWVTSVHLFVDQDWLEDGGLNVYIEYSRMRRAENLRNLKITLRYCDWMAFSYDRPFVLDAKREYYVPSTGYSKATDELPTEVWGSELKRLRWLKTFELELETTEEKQMGLDDIVEQAVTWRFPQNDGFSLVLDPARTERTGWQWSEEPAEPYNELEPNDPQEAKERLVKDGVDFIVWDGEPEILDEDCLTFYVVTLSYEAQRV